VGYEYFRGFFFYLGSYRGLNFCWNFAWGLFEMKFWWSFAGRVYGRWLFASFFLEVCFEWNFYWIFFWGTIKAKRSFCFPLGHVGCEFFCGFFTKALYRIKVEWVFFGSLVEDENFVGFYLGFLEAKRRLWGFLSGPILMNYL